MHTSENAKTIMNKLVNRFESGDIGELVKLSTIRLTAKNSMPSENWSFSNQFLALFQSGEIDCRGFSQWKQVKRHVKTGATAVYILAPIIVKRKTDDGDEYTQLVGFKSAPVFPLSATDGEPLPEINKELSPESLPPLVDVAKKWGIKVTYIPFKGNAYGTYSDSEKNIRLASHEEVVFFHELAHSAHAKIEKLKGGQDARQETIAEFTACVLMEVYGLKDTTNEAWKYIKHYNPENPVNAVVSALDTIGKVLDLILTTSEE